MSALSYPLFLSGSGDAVADWWNLDQALIWIAERDLAQVEDAEGDPAGVQSRRYNYWALIGGAEYHEDEESDPLEASLPSPHELLLKLLRNGDLKAARADAETDEAISSRLFSSYQIEWHGADCNTVLARPRTKIEQAKGSALDLLHITMRRNDMIALFPAKAPEGLEAELAALLAPAKSSADTSAEVQQEPAFGMKGRPLSTAATRAEQIIREMPSGFPEKGSGHGERQRAIRAINSQLRSEGYSELSADTIGRAADRAKAR